MAVYVDAANLPFRRMVMCHMVADSHEELVAMADRIGVARRWIQKRGLPAEHFDICLSKKKLALAAGALEISQRDLGRLLRRKGEAADEGSRSTPPAERRIDGEEQRASGKVAADHVPEMQDQPEMARRVLPAMQGGNRRSAAR